MFYGYLIEYLISRTAHSHHPHTQQTQGVEPMLIYCWPTVYDGGPTLKQHWFNALRFLGTAMICDPVLSQEGAARLHFQQPIQLTLSFSLKQWLFLGPHITWD